MLADEVKLNNGDVLTGTIIKKETDKLIFNTSYAGDLSIAWSDIVSLNSEAPVKIFLNDETVVSGVIEKSEPGHVKIKANHLETKADIDLKQLEYINPSAAVSGIGVAWSGNINLGGAITQGNTETSLIRADAEAIARTKKNRFTIGGVVNRAQSNKIDTERNVKAYTKYDSFLTKQWYLYTNGTLENDRFRDINLRTTAGVGSGYQIYEQDDLNLAIEGGVNYINVDYGKAQDNGYASGRWALRYDQKLFSSNVQLFHQDEILFSLEDINNTLVFSKTGLRIPIANHLNASTQVNLDYNNQPVAGREKLDKTLLFSLGYGW